MRLWRLMRNNPSAVLMITQLLGIVVYPFLETSSHRELGNTVLSLFGLLVLGLAVLAVRPTPSLTWVSLLLGLPIVVLTIVDAVTGFAQPWHFVNDFFHAAFYAYTGLALIRYMFADHEVGSDEMWSTGATFTVWVWAFAYVYSMMQTLVPGSFTLPADNTSGMMSWTELLFLSGTTMTNTGLSDIVPLKPNARSVVMLEQLAGIMYLALVVSRLMNMVVSKKPAEFMEQRKHQRDGSHRHEREDLVDVGTDR